MQTQPDPNLNTDIENPMQERDCGPAAGSAEETAEAVLTALRLEARAERSRSIREETDGGMPLFVP
ncbi:MAG: hypothetical protein AB1846_17315 [Chloroflexota bacterium]